MRARQFIAQRVSAELSAGYLNSGVGTFIRHERLPGFTADARINVQDMLAVVVTYDDVSWPQSTSDSFEYVDNVSRGRGLKAGVSAGSWVGVGATAAVVVLFGLFAWAYSQGT